jgi:hypothetical protein
LRKVKQKVNGLFRRERWKKLTATETGAKQGNSKRGGCYVLLISNTEHLDQIGCHITTAVFSEIAIVRQGILVIQLKKGVFRIVHGPNVVYVPLDLATV